MSVNHLRVGVSPWPKMNHKCYPHRIKGCDVGMELEILETVAIALNITLEFRISHIKGCGKPENGLWTGLAGMLLNNEIDIIGNLCDYDQLRQAAFGLSIPVWQYPNAFLMKVPEAPVYFHPLAPFSRSVWLAFGLCSLLWYFFLVFYLVCFTKMPLLKSLYKAASELAKFTFGFEEPAIIETFWLLWFGFLGVILMLYNNYIIRAVVFSYPIEKPFKNGQDFAKSVADGRFFLLDYRDPPESMCYGTMCDNLNIGINRGHYVYSSNSSGGALLEKLVNNGKLVMMRGRTFLETYLADFTNRDELWLFDDDSMTESRSVFMWRKNFIHEKAFNHILWNLAEFKLNVRLRRLQTGGRKVRVGNKLIIDVKEDRTLSMQDFHGPANILLGGIGISVFLFALETLLGTCLRYFLAD